MLVTSRGVQLYHGIAQRWGTNQIRGMHTYVNQVVNWQSVAYGYMY